MKFRNCLMMILFTYMAVTMYLVQICSQRGFYLQLLNISKFNSFPLSLKCLNLNYVESFSHVSSLL